MQVCQQDRRTRRTADGTDDRRLCFHFICVNLLYLRFISETGDLIASNLYATKRAYEATSPTRLSETALESEVDDFTTKGTKSTKMMASSLRALLFFVVTKSPWRCVRKIVVLGEPQMAQMIADYVSISSA